jgi:hypothetical protein
VLEYRAKWLPANGIAMSVILKCSQNHCDEAGGRASLHTPVLCITVHVTTDVADPWYWRLDSQLLHLNIGNPMQNFIAKFRSLK